MKVCLLQNASKKNDNILEPHNALIYVGQDDKTKIPIGRKLPTAATSKQSVKAIVSTDTSASAADHDFTSEALIPSVTLRMNLSVNPTDSLFSGGKDGISRVYVLLHDATLDPSTGIKHATNLRSLLNLMTDNNTSLLPYSVLLEADGGPNHNLNFLSNQLALLLDIMT